MKKLPEFIFDLGATVKVIDESGKTPKWKTVGKCVVAQVAAQRVLKDAGYKCGWMFDGFEKQFITVVS